MNRRSLVSVGVGILFAWTASGQGTESFSNLPTASASSYLARSWTGDDGVTWTAEGARTDQTITGKAICFGNSGNRWVTSPSYAGGMGTLTFKYVRAFTGTSARSLEVYVNGSKFGSTITVSPTSDTVVTYSQPVNTTGNVVLEIRSTGAAQVKVDDVAWTSYSGSIPVISAPSSAPSVSAFYGSASGSSSVSVSGANLTADITATAPTSFEVSNDDTTWGATTTFAQSGGSASGTLYVRLAATAAVGAHSGNVTLSSTGATGVDVAVSGTVDLAAPTTAAATDVSTDGFTANWSAVPGATGYEVDVFAGRQSSATSRLIISQYVETDAGTTPKGIELLNVSDEVIDFSVDNLVVYVGFNGGTPVGWVTNAVGTLAPGKVLVVGTSDVGTYLDATFGAGVVPYKYANFTFNGDDALVVELGGVTEDVIGTPGTRPDPAWAADGISTANQNLSLLADTLDGDADGWTDPSLRFETVSSTPSTAGGLAGFGQAPFPLEIFVERATEVAGGTTTSYAVTGLQPGTEYTYVVRAVDSASSYIGANSDERNVTTLAADTAPTVTVNPLAYSVDENEVVSFLVTVFDAEDHAVTLDMDLDAASLTPTATTNVYEFAWTPTSAGVTSVTFVATANGLQSTPVEVTITVLEAQGGDPVQPAVASVAVSATLVVVTFDVAAGLENDVTYELVSATALGTDPATWTPVAATYAAVDADTATLTAALPAGDTRFFHVKASR